MFYEIAMEHIKTYVAIMQSVPGWFLWVYIAITAIAVIYAAVGTRTLNRLFWIIVSLVFPFVALPMEIAVDIAAVQYHKKHPPLFDNGRKRYRLPFRLRFVIIPAAGALAGLAAGSIIGKYSSLMDEMKIPCVLTGALFLQLILLLTEYRRCRKNIRYFKIAEKNNQKNSDPPVSDIFSHSVHETEAIDSVDAELIIALCYSKMQDYLNKGVKTVQAGGKMYAVSVINEYEFRRIRDVESVSFEDCRWGYMFERITCVEWDLGKENKLTSSSAGTRTTIWRAAPLNIPLIFEALTSAMMSLFFLTPAGLILHSSILGLAAGWFIA